MRPMQFPEHRSQHFAQRRIVRRLRHGTAEYTAKQAIRAGQRWVLRPLSDDPEWQDDIILEPEGDTEIEVTDIVIAKWSPIGRGRRA